MSWSIRTIAKFAAATAAILLLVVVLYLATSMQNLRLKSAPAHSVAAIAEELVERQLLPSISYAVVENGRLVSTRTLGLADLETGEVASEKTLYEAASLTKPVVAEIARRLFERGVFELDERVADSLSIDRIQDASVWRLVTPRHLLSHTSGLPNWSGDSRDPSRADSLEFDFEPGSAFQYSGEGYGVLLAFLEAKSSQSADDLANALFREIGMTSSTMIAKGAPGHYARGHWADSPGRQGWRTSTPVAAYSLFTNASDYGKFLEYVIAAHAVGISNDDPFTKVQAELAEQPSGETLGWSLGWGTLQRTGDSVYFQWGDNGAFRSFAAFEPAGQNGVVYFTNGSFGTIYADALAAPILGDVTTASSWFSSSLKEQIRKLIRY